MSQRYCSKCGGIIIADTEDWFMALCYSCWTEIGQPANEPQPAEDK